MRDSVTKKIAIVWEGYEAGGVDSYLAYLLDSWPENDEIYLFYNTENLGIDRLKSIMKNKTVKFFPVKTVFKYYSGNTTTSLVCKYLLHFFSPLFYLINIFYYKSLFLNQNFDILLAQNGGYPGSLGVISSCVGAHLAGINVKTLVIHHAANSPLPGHRIFRYLVEKNLNRLLSSIIAISNATKETIITRTSLFNVSDKNITVIENGIPIPKKKKEFTQDKERKQKIAIIGRLDPHKGHDDFLMALSLISKDLLKKISVDFIGGYKEKDFKRVSKLIEDFGLMDVVKIRGYVDLSTSEIILSLDLVVMATKDFEGFGLTIIEALHSGVPVIATRVGIVPELFSDEDVMSVEPLDSNSMAVALKTFINTEDKKTLISEEVISKLENYDSRFASKRYRDHLIDMF